ncbi:MAG TPA: isoprenylcysteine carboxylmethyltransferase family protein [Thermoflexales bacterium]|nr:isoprenylcysteine carboxylmethyltransferase family protein [Thermoflexales bacterium]HQW36608.1 isoprenylcysteine carboxylmethyltransferase family protein [Thermoflexales bacterium]HQZ21311.1 isoprenylcysteine carboxylmethyltransferase family protein [Thermoflexales bacterium]
MKDSRFIRRGGAWVAAQFIFIPLMVLAILALRAMGIERGIAPPAGAVLRGLGALIGAGGVVLLMKSVADLGRNLTAFPAPLEDASLVQTGAYAWARHPIYAAIILLMLACALFFTSLFGMACAALVFIFFDRKSAREEIFLREKYAAYAEYARRVKKLIPFVY